MRAKGIVWDLDGTLLDTLCDLTASVNAALAACGMPPRTQEEVRRFVGNGAVKLMERAVPAGTDAAAEAAALAAFRAHYAVHANDATKPYPGIPALLSRLAAAGVRMAIVSNKPDFAVRSLAETYFATLMTAAVGAREGVPTKPAPDLVLAAIREMGLTPADCVYVGDSEVDVATAKAAGVAGIFVNWGYRGREFLLDHGAETVVDTPEEMNEVILG